MTTLATAYFTPMASVVANLGGAVQSLPGTYQLGGRQRTAGGVLTLASQGSGTTFGLCRIPLFCTILGITVVNSVSLGSATLALGDANNTSLYMAAATFTGVDTPTRVGKTVQTLAQLTQGYDCTTGNPTNYSSGQSAAPQSSGFGALYEDITVTTAAASLPASGTLCILVDYMID